MLVMKRSFSGLSLLILIISNSPMFGLGSVVQKSYFHEQQHCTWQEARQKCQSLYSDLAFIQSKDDTLMIYYSEYNSWLSLNKVSDAGGLENWSWSDGTPLGYSRWATDQPHPSDSCAYVHYPTRMFYSSPCDNYFFIYCTVDPEGFVNKAMTLIEAKNYCMKHYKTIAYFISSTQVDGALHMQDFPLWVNTVKDITVQGFGNQHEQCSTVSPQSKLLATHNCSEHFPFVCMDDNLVLVKEQKSWEEAVNHCREMVLSPDDNSRYELVSIQAGIDDAHMSARASQADTEQVWVGLRFLGGTWFWIDKVYMSYPNLPQCPLPGKNCGVLSKKTIDVETADCGEKKNFLCYSF